MSTLTVYFDEPWWVGVVEQEEMGELRLFRHVFGSEPSTAEIYELVLRDMERLFTQPAVKIETHSEPPKRVNPKRVLRDAARETAIQGISTKSQEAMRLLIEAGKQERHIQSRAEREREADLKREKARAKALARKRGH